MSTSAKGEVPWQILNRKTGRFAMIALPSGERIIISIGSATAKILVRRSVFGWLLPRTIASEQLSAWQSEYPQYNDFYRQICRGMVLEGLLASLSHCQSIAELQAAWAVMKNPVAVTGLAMMRETQAPNAKDDIG
jgi:hypothetical protein